MRWLFCVQEGWRRQWCRVSLSLETHPRWALSHAASFVNQGREAQPEGGGGGREGAAKPFGEIGKVVSMENNLLKSNLIQTPENSVAAMKTGFT